MLGRYLFLLIISGSSFFLKQSQSKILWSRLFKTNKRITSFHERTGAFLQAYLTRFWFSQNCSYGAHLVIDILGIMVLTSKNQPDNWQGFDANSNTHPTLKEKTIIFYVFQQYLIERRHGGRPYHEDSGWSSRARE